MKKRHGVMPMRVLVGAPPIAVGPIAVGRRANVHADRPGMMSGGPCTGAVFVNYAPLAPRILGLVERNAVEIAVGARVRTPLFA